MPAPTDADRAEDRGGAASPSRPVSIGGLSPGGVIGPAVRPHVSGATETIARERVRLLTREGVDIQAAQQGAEGVGFELDTGQIRTSQQIAEVPADQAHQVQQSSCRITRSHSSVGKLWASRPVPPSRPLASECARRSSGRRAGTATGGRVTTARSPLPDLEQQRSSSGHPSVLQIERGRPGARVEEP